MKNRKLLIVGILLTGLLLGCGIGDPDHFVRFQVDGKNYVVENPTFVVTRLEAGVRFFDLSYSPISAVPGAIVQWRMHVESPEKLVGRELDLNTVDPNKVPPTILLELTEDLILQSRKNSSVHFKIDRIEEGMVEGSFSVTNLAYVSKKQKIDRTVDTTARFRVKLAQKNWEDAIRSRKRSSK